MSRRVSKVAVAVLVLSLVLPAPAALAARRSSDIPAITPIERVVRAVKNFVKKLGQGTHEDTNVNPRPPIP